MKTITGLGIFQINLLKQSIKNYLNDPILDEVIDRDIIIHTPHPNRKNEFITDESVQRYIKSSIKLFEFEYKKPKDAL